MNTRRHLSLLVYLLVVGCGQSSGPDRRPCIGAKCDIPEGEAGEQCVERRREAFNDNKLAFTEPALRWSCEDTPGVNGIDRGQEYCEYFSVLSLPAAEYGGLVPDPFVLGRLIRIEPEDPDDPEAYATYEQTPIGVQLTGNQIDELEADPSAIVGKCVFTSWNLDAEERVPACETGACPAVQGVPVDAENFRMKFDFNSTDAAQILADDCLDHPKSGDLHDPEDPLHDDFFRGCMINAEVNDTAYRKSDSTICSAVNRLAECGCDVDGGDLAVALSPFERRGFRLGTWSGSNALPPGCSYVELGDGSNTVVECELSADDVLSYSSDPKTLCRQRYAPNVVVHVPIDASAVTCDPGQSQSPYAGSCAATPWVLSDDGNPTQQN